MISTLTLLYVPNIPAPRPLQITPAKMILLEPLLPLNSGWSILANSQSSLSMLSKITAIFFPNYPFPAVYLQLPIRKNILDTANSSSLTNYPCSSTAAPPAHNPVPTLLLPSKQTLPKLIPGHPHQPVCPLTEQIVPPNNPLIACFGMWMCVGGGEGSLVWEPSHPSEVVLGIVSRNFSERCSQRSITDSLLYLPWSPA